jgi:hypothetical protein
MYKEVECLSKISVRRRKRKKGVEREIDSGENHIGVDGDFGQ